MENATWRLIISSSPHHGAVNMASDEAILFAVGKRIAPPTLRLYSWKTPCLSLGFAQSTSDVDLNKLSELNWELVRRPTGGKAILHCDELTYAVIAPIDEPRVQGSVLSSYLRLSQGLLRALSIMGALAHSQESYGESGNAKTKGPVCFEVPSNYEITIDGKKIIGSAQARRNGGVLQHGTLPLFGDLTRITKVLKFDTPANQNEVSQRLLKHATTLETALGTITPWEQACQAFTEGFSNALDLYFLEEELSPEEVALAEKLFHSKYNHESWTFRK